MADSTTARGRPLGPCGRATRERLLDALAKRLDADPRYGTTTARDVARDAWVSPSAFYQYFDDLLHAMAALAEERGRSEPDETGELRAERDRLAAELAEARRQAEDLADLDQAAARRKEYQDDRDRAVQRWYEEHTAREAAEAGLAHLRALAAPLRAMTAPTPDFGSGSHILACAAARWIAAARPLVDAALALDPANPEDPDV